MKTQLPLCAVLCGLVSTSLADPKPVNISNFARAETDMYFAKAAKDGAFGKLRHRREPAEIDKQDVVRMTQNTRQTSSPSRPAGTTPCVSTVRARKSSTASGNSRKHSR